MTESPYRWVIVAAGGLLGCVAIGAHVFVAGSAAAHRPGYRLVGDRRVERDDDRLSRNGVRQHGLGHLSDRVGPRAMVLTGSIVLAASLALASQATSLLAFQLLFGLLVGASAAAIFAPMMACVTGWFDTHRSLAVSLVSAGMGMAPMTMSPLGRWLVSAMTGEPRSQILAAIAAAS